MKLKFAVSSWTILIPSLVLNIGLLVATLFFLKQMDIFYVQATQPAFRLEAGSKPPAANAVRLAVHGTPLPSGDIRSAGPPH